LTADVGRTMDQDTPALRGKSDEFCKQLMDNLHDAVYCLDRERRITYWNKAAEKLTGYCAQEVLGTKCNDNVLVHVDESGYQLCKEDCPASHAMASGVPQNKDIYLRHKLGHKLSVSVHASSLVDSQGRIVGAVEVFSDNSQKREAQEQAKALGDALKELDATCARLHTELAERKRVEEALSRSEGHLRTIVDNLPIGVLFTDAQGNLIFANAALQQIWGGVRFGGVEQYAAYKGWWASTGKQVKAEEWAAYRAVRNGETSVNEVIEIETFDGQRKTIFNSAFPVRDEKGRIVGAVVTNEDITERQHGQESLIRSEKLASAGRMAATIAHEINNPIAAVMNLLYVLGANPSLDADAAKLITVIDEEIGRLANISRTTLGFYRNDSDHSVVNVAKLLDEAVELYSRKVQENSIYVDRRHVTEQFVSANEGELRHLFANLISNSVDACPSGGRLLLRVIPFREWGNSQKPGLKITIADNGRGIDPRHRRNIFEPFFTTKETVGNGLGLWVSKTIVQKHGGTIRVRSSQGRGTVFQIFLPKSRAEGAF